MALLTSNAIRMCCTSADLESTGVQDSAIGQLSARTGHRSWVTIADFDAKYRSMMLFVNGLPIMNFKIIIT